MRHQKKGETGAIAIEAILGITVFLMAVCTLLFISYLVRVEAKVQYAVDQTAKEISSYYYFADVLGLSEYTIGSAREKSEAQVNEVLNGFMDFSTATGDLVSDFSLDIKDIKKTGDNAVAAYNKGKDLYETLKTSAKNPKGLLQGVLTTVMYAGTKKFVMPFLCKLIVPKYIGENEKQQKAFFEMAGMKNGVDDIDFTCSSLLDDDRSITVTAIYKINMKKLSFGLLDIDLTFCNSATTAAWLIPGTNENGPKTLAEAYKKRNKDKE